MLRLVLSVTLMFLPLAAWPQSQRLQPLFDALRMDEMLSIIREEGLDYAELIEQDMFAGDGGALWEQEVDRIYDAGRLAGLLRQGFGEEPGDGALAQMTGFFQTPLGARISGLELRAREIMLDPSGEEEAGQLYEDLKRENGPRYRLLHDFATANDLIESNVVGGLNSNLAFYQGLADSKAFDAPLPQERVLADVWSQEDLIRSEAEEWVFSFLALAYQPLEDAELREYVELSRTREGQAFNRALFDAFDAMFKVVSYDLGLAAGRSLRGKDI